MGRCRRTERVSRAKWERGEGLLIELLRLVESDTFTIPSRCVAGRPFERGARHETRVLENDVRDVEWRSPGQLNLELSGCIAIDVAMEDSGLIPECARSPCSAAIPFEILVAGLQNVGIDRMQIDFVTCRRAIALEIGDDIPPCTGWAVANRLIDEGIVIGPTGERVLATAAGELIIAVAAVEGVAAGPTIQRVVIIPPFSFRSLPMGLWWSAQHATTIVAYTSSRYSGTWGTSRSELYRPDECCLMSHAGVLQA